MASHPPEYSHFLILFILSFVVVVESARLGSSYKTTQHPPPMYPQINDFPNEKLYHAYFVIQRFKNTITCDPRNITSTWTGHDICGIKSYVGFHCTGQPGRDDNLKVTEAIFNGFGLCAPKLLGFVDQLPDLAHFQATSNNFGGDLPGLVGSLDKMYSTDGYEGGLLDSKKSNRAGTPHYNGFNLDGAEISGTTRGDLVHTLLDPLGTRINAHLPPNNPSSPSTEKLGFPKMSYLALANNKLKGPIPPSIAEARDTLLEVLLLNNQLSGCLPHELGMLAKATVIDAGINQLTGPIPSSLSCLSSVEQLNLAGNRLYGNIPDALCKLSGTAGRLTNLTLSENYFTSVGPACSTLIDDGVLDIKNNCIPGLSNQRRPAECAAFHSQPKTCPAATTDQVKCPAAAPTNAAAPVDKKARDYSSYVTYATLHE